MALHLDRDRDDAARREVSIFNFVQFAQEVQEKIRVEKLPCDVECNSGVE